MIVLPSRNIAFIHIPKCGGTSIRAALQRLDPGAISIGGRVEKPGIGTVATMHMPLDLMRDHFPDYFDLLAGKELFAILRDPQSRFRSAFAQYFLHNGLGAVSEHSDARIRTELETVLAELSGGAPDFANRLVHFTPQLRYVVCDGVQMVGNLFPLERMDLFDRRVSALTGETVTTGHSSRNATPDRRSLWDKHGLGPRVGGLLGKGVAAGLQKASRRYSGLLGEPFSLDWLLKSEEVRSFVAEFYAEDAALCARLRATLSEAEDAPSAA